MSGAGLTRELNGNWKGGKTITADGYVLVRVGTEHPMADVRGYAYEHRLIMAEKLGRPLTKTEMVEHRNRIRRDNQLSNLLLFRNRAEALAARKGMNSRQKEPGEPNEIIACACECGATFLKFDASHRRRRFVSGHNIQPSS